MNSQLSKALKFVVFTSIAIALLYFVFKDVDLNEMWLDIKQADFYWVGLSLVVALIGYVSRAIRWNFLLEPLGYKASFKNRLLSVIFGYFANLAFPRLGEVARCGALSRQENLPVDKLLGTVIVERVIDVFMLMLIGTVTFFVKIDLFGTFLLEKIILPIKTSIVEINISKFDV